MSVDARANELLGGKSRSYQAVWTPGQREELLEQGWVTPILPQCWQVLRHLQKPTRPLSWARELLNKATVSTSIG